MSKPIIFNEMESVEIAANLARDAETGAGGDRQGLEDVDINIDPVDDVATATSNKTSSTSSKVKGLFYLGGVACGAAAGFAYGGVEINKAGAVQSQMAGAVKPSKAPRATKAPKSVCPAKVDSTCLSDDRQAILESEFGIPIDNVDATGYTKLENVFVQSRGYAVPSGNTITIDELKDFDVAPDGIDSLYKVPISDFKCLDEAYALATSVCDYHNDCTFVSVGEDYGTSNYAVALEFFSDDSVTAIMDSTPIEEGASVPGFDDAPRERKAFTVFIKDAVATPPDFSSFQCNVPPFTQAAQVYGLYAILFLVTANPAFGITVGSLLSDCCGSSPTAALCGPAFGAANNAAVANQVPGAPFAPAVWCTVAIPDFLQYMAPAADCLLVQQQSDPSVNFQQCLQCVSKFSSKFNCNSGPKVCEEDDAMNFITAMPCGGGVQTDCVCDACGHVCGTQCKAQIQTSVSCQQGSPAQIVINEKGDFVESGSCLNSQIDSGSRDFSCPSPAPE